MDQYLPVDPGSVGRVWPRHWRDIPQSPPVEITQTDPEPLTLAKAKEHLQIDANFTDHDSRIATLCVAVRRQVETDRNETLARSVLEMTFDQFPIERAMTLPRPPLLSITSISSFDYNGVETVMSGSDYLADVNGWPGRVVLVPNAIWPTGVRPYLGGKIRWAAGFVTVPDRAIQAMKLLLGHWFENTEAVTSGADRYTPESYPLGYEALIGDRLVSMG